MATIDFFSKEVHIDEVWDRRVKHGKLEYLVRVNCGGGYIFHWFAKESLDCPELLAKYETGRQAYIGCMVRAMTENKDSDASTE